MLQENGGSWAVLACPIQALVAGEETTIKFEVNAAASYANAIFGLMLGKLDGAETPEGEHTLTISKISLVEVKKEQAPVATTSNGEGVELLAPIQGNVVDIKVKVGDKVIYSKYAGTEVELDGEEYLVVKQNDILAVIK